MEASIIKKALKEQRKLNLSGNLYYKTQLDFAYNTNHIEGSTLLQMRQRVFMILVQF